MMGKDIPKDNPISTDSILPIMNVKIIAPIITPIATVMASLPF